MQNNIRERFITRQIDYKLMSCKHSFVNDLLGEKHLTDATLDRLQFHLKTASQIGDLLEKILNSVHRKNGFTCSETFFHTYSSQTPNHLLQEQKHTTSQSNHKQGDLVLTKVCYSVSSYCIASSYFLYFAQSSI